MAFGESLSEAVARETREETGLVVGVGPLRYVVDFVRPPLHAVSFYFECSARGTPTAGGDPELGDSQLIRSLRFVPLDELPNLQVYPEGLADWLAEDARNGFAAGVQYRGTLR